MVAPQQLNASLTAPDPLLTAGLSVLNPYEASLMAGDPLLEAVLTVADPPAVDLTATLQAQVNLRAALTNVPPDPTVLIGGIRVTPLIAGDLTSTPPPDVPLSASLSTGEPKLGGRLRVADAQALLAGIRAPVSIEAGLTVRNPYLASLAAAEPRIAAQLDVVQQVRLSASVAVSVVRIRALLTEQAPGDVPLRAGVSVAAIRITGDLMVERYGAVVRVTPRIDAALTVVAPEPTELSASLRTAPIDLAGDLTEVTGVALQASLEGPAPTIGAGLKVTQPFGSVRMTAVRPDFGSVRMTSVLKPFGSVRMTPVDQEMLRLFGMVRMDAVNRVPAARGDITVFGAVHMTAEPSETSLTFGHVRMTANQTTDFGSVRMTAHVEPITPPMMPDPDDPDAMIPVPVPPTGVPGRPRGDLKPLQYRLLALWHGEWRDLTDRLLSFTTTEGSLTPKQIGHVTEDAGASITLDNRDGAMSLYSPAEWVDTRPGNRALLTAASQDGEFFSTVMSGWIRSLQGPEHRDVLTETVEMVLHGVFGRIQGFYNELFDPPNVENIPDWLTGEIIEQMLDNVGYDGLRRIDRGTVVVRGLGAQEIGLRSQGNQPADTLTSIGTVSSAELGRTRARRDGAIVFENANLRFGQPREGSRLWLLGPEAPGNETYDYSGPLQPLDPYGLIINKIAGSGAELAIRGRGAGETDFLEGYSRIDEPFYRLAADETTLELDYLIDRVSGHSKSVVYVLRTEPMQQGFHYTVLRDDLQPATSVTAEAHPITGGVRVIVTKPTGFAVGIRIRRLVGVAYEYTNLLDRPVFLTRTNDESLRQYGLQEVNYVGASLIADTNRGLAEARLDYLIENYNGITSPPFRQFRVSLDASYYPRLIEMQVGDRVQLYGGFGLTGQQFQIDLIEQQLDDNDAHTMVLGVTEYRPLMVSPF